MRNKTLAAMTAVGLAAAIAVPNLAFGGTPRLNVVGVQPAVSFFTARLAGANENPAGDPDGLGSALVTLDMSTAGAEQVCWNLQYTNITGTPSAAHIHGPAAPGANAGVVIGFTPFTDLTPTGGVGCRDLTAAELTVAHDIMIRPLMYYVNVHTSDFPGGAIRGSVIPQGAGEAHFLPTPLRAYDSREAAPVAKIAANETRTISLATGHELGSTTAQQAVPPGATAAIVTLTVTETNGGPGGNGGFLKIYSVDSPEPATSNINWAGPDQNLAVNTQVAVDATSSVKVKGGANSTHFVIDVVGYYFSAPVVLQDQSGG